MLQTVGNIDRQSGGEDGRVTGWSSANPSRSRNIELPSTAGGMSKQKSPVANDSQTTKDPLLPSSNFMRSSGSSRRPAVSGSRDPVIAGSDSDRVRTTDTSPRALRKISSAAQRSSPALSSDPKHTASGRNISNIKNLEPTVKGIEGLNLNTNERLHY